VAFRLEISDEAFLRLRKLDNKTADRILSKLEDAAANPRHFFERLSGSEQYKLRIGDYRAIAKIDYKEKALFVVSVGHRKNIYG